MFSLFKLDPIMIFSPAKNDDALERKKVVEQLFVYVMVNKY